MKLILQAALAEIAGEPVECHIFRRMSDEGIWCWSWHHRQAHAEDTAVGPDEALAAACRTLRAALGLPEDPSLLYHEALRYKQALQAAESFVRALIDHIDLPSCSGKWISGSGGHRVHEECSRLATWARDDDCWAYCDEHVPYRERGTPEGYPEVPYVEALRAYEEAAKR